MLAQDPAFFIFNGDTIYADATTKVGGAGRTLPEYWAKYKENREDGFFQALTSRVPLIVNCDDHEVANDFRGPEEPLMPVGRRAFHQYWPLSVGPERIYRSVRWGREVEVFVRDGRQYADPLAAPDGPDKSLLGVEQRAWLLDAVTRSTATWKVLVSSSPLSTLRSVQGPQDDYASYEHEHEHGLILDAFRDAGVDNFVWLTADVHWGQAVEYPERGFWEFVGSPIGANPRAASRPLAHLRPAGAFPAAQPAAVRERVRRRGCRLADGPVARRGRPGDVRGDHPRSLSGPRPSVCGEEVPRCSQPSTARPEDPRS